ncbi:hypothetical protein [Kineococcus radiotolerans]|uniref:hypothetical protein n=1 Tax=Kineococcus radiotolerans TaxID=131568 RepID=UPI000053D355|nr:hypothetical protein [Kineococcus radiotolerans]
MSRAGAVLLVAVLGVGGTAGCTAAESVPPVPSSSAPTASPAPPPVPASAPGDLRVATVETREDGVGPGGTPVVRWSVDWELRWAAVPDAASYAVRYASAEGIPAGAAADETTAGTSLRVTAAAGTSSPQRQATERDAGLLLTSSQLLVSVGAVGADGSEGPATGWVPVGDVPADGRPVTTLPHEHAPGEHAH